MERISTAQFKTVERINEWVKKAKSLIKTDLKKAALLTARIKREAYTTGYLKGQADAYRLSGIINSSRNKISAAISDYENAMILYQKLNEKSGIAMVYNNLGIINFRMSKFSEATQYYFRALRLKEELDDKSGMISTLTNIGSVYQKQSNFAEAIRFYNKAIRISRQVKDEHVEAVNYQNIGEVYIEQRKFKQAKENLTKAAVHFQHTRQYPSLVSVYINIGVILKHEKKYNEAIEVYNQAKSIASKEKLRMEVALCDMNIGEIYLEQHNYKEAKTNMMKVVSYLKNKPGNDTLIVVYEHLANLTYKNKQYREAYRFLKQYLHIFRNTYRKEHSNHISEIHMRYEVEKREREAEIFRLRNVELKDALNKLDEEKKRSDSLLQNILPVEVAEDLKSHGQSPARLYESVSVMFIDIQNFTGISEHLTPQELLKRLSFYFTAFEKIISKYRIEKIKTIGDAFMCAAGLPVPLKNHAQKMVEAAIEIVAFIEQYKKTNPKEAFDVRIGIHTGPVIAGIVGTQKFAYDIWGDTVNTAARMEQHGQAGRINVSATTYQLLKKKFSFEYRGKVPAKNKGEIDMYFVSLPN